MRRVPSLRLALVGVLLGATLAGAQGSATIYEGARLITGDGSSPIDDGAFVVTNGRITAIGRRGQVSAPGATRVNLAGKTVMPTLNNVHLHIGYEGFTSWSAANHTADNVADHLRREAYYGVGAVMTMGDQPTDFALQFDRDQKAGKFPSTARLLVAAGLALPGAGPDSLLIQGTTPLKAVYEVTTPDEARAAVRKVAAAKIPHVKIWVDDRDAQRGALKQKMPPEIFTAVIDEAHKAGILVHAHATTLANQKAVVRAGADVLVHTVSNERLDDEFLALLREKKPYWAPVMGLTDLPEVCEPNNLFVEQSLPPATIADIRDGKNAFNLPGCAAAPAPVARRQEFWSYNVPRMVQNGARLLLATDAGVLPGYSFGWAEHHEMALYVKSGLTPAEVLVASTSRPTEVLKNTETGSLQVGKRADFVVLGANPLENIRNTRSIEAVYFNGARLNRDQIAASWKRASPSR